MNRVLILTAILFLSIVLISCGIDTGDTGDTGATCNGSDKFCHSHDGLNWSDASSDINRDDAADYCKNLGGRLPTISELRTLIQNCLGTETGGECGVADECLSAGDCYNNNQCDKCEYDETNSGKYSVFGKTASLWSSSEPTDYEGYAWLVYFSSGSVIANDKNIRYDVRCVK